MTSDIHPKAEPHDSGWAVEPFTGSALRVKKSLRSGSGGLLTSTALVSAGFALVTGSAAAEVPEGYAPAPAEIVSYVQLSNGSVLVQLANNQSLLVTSNNYFIDNAGILYLSPGVSGSVSSGATTAAAPASLINALPEVSNQAPPSSTGVLFDDTALATNSGGMMASITGGPGLFGLGTLGTIAAVGLGTGAVVLGVNAIRARLEENDSSNTAAALTVVDEDVVRGETGGSVSYTIADADGLDQSELKTAVENALGGASTVASIFPNGATVVVEGASESLVDGTTDTYPSLTVTLTGDIEEALNLGSFPGPAVTFSDAKGNAESVNFALDISASDGGSSGSLELDQADGSTHEIAQGGSKLFKATDPDGDTVTYQISNNPSGIGIDSNTGLIVVASSVATGSYTITVLASSTGADGSVQTDTEAYNINVIAGSAESGSAGNVVAADFDSASAGFNTLTGLNTTDGAKANSDDNEFEVVAASHLANSFVLDGLAGDDTVYFSQAGATYHLDPINENAFEDVSGFETLVLLSNVDLEINGGVLDSDSKGRGDIEHIQGSGDNVVTLVNSDADMGLDVAVTNLASIELNGYDLTLDHADLSQIDKITGENLSKLVFTGQFTYDFAEGLIETQGVSRLGLDGGNYSYVLTLDGVHDEDVREIYADAANEIEGDVIIDARENSKVTLIDLAGDSSTTGGLDGDSNIFVTFDDKLTILGGQNDNDVDVILDNDIEDNDFQFIGGEDGDDSLNINLNGDEIDNLGFGRAIDNVEYVDIDAPDGDGEAHLEFSGASNNVSSLEVADLSDVKDESTIKLSGDNGASVDAGTGTVAATIAEATANWAAGNTIATSISTADILLSGFVAARDTSIVMTDQDDTIDLVIGESNLKGDFAVTATGLAGAGAGDHLHVDADLITGASSVASIVNGQATGRVTVDLDDAGAGDPALSVAGYTINGSANVSTAKDAAFADQKIAFVQASGAGGADGSEAVHVELGGGSDSVSLVLGSAQTELVTLVFARSDIDERETISFKQLADLAGASGSASVASGLKLDFQDDVSALIGTTGTSLASINLGAASQHNAVITYTSTAGNGFFVDVDGDGRWTDGDINVDLTDVTGTGTGVAVAGNVMTVTTDNGQEDVWEFQLDGGNLVDNL